MANDTQLTTLPSGLRIVSAAMPHAESVSVGVWVAAGARDERGREHGIAHMLEHMAFKGTSSRTAAQIAQQVEDKGGYINAHTSREETAYYLRLLAEDLEFGVDLLSDIITASIFPEDEIEREKGVIIQEIGQAADTPDDIVFDLFQSQSHPDNPMGRPILGTTETVSSFRRDDLTGFMDRHYAASSLVISAAGKIDHAALVAMVQEKLGHLKGPAASDPRVLPFWPKDTDNRIALIERDLEQAHLVLGLPGFSFQSEDRLALSAMTTLFGGGMSSRLFQEAREKRGLCYSVFSFSQSFSDSGVLAVYAGTSQEDAAQMTRLIGEQLVDIAAHAKEDETNRALAQMRASLLMQQESVSNLAETMARQMMIFDRLISPQEWLEKIEAITVDDMRRIASQLLTQKPVLAGIGPGKPIDWIDQVEMDKAFAA